MDNESTQAYHSTFDINNPCLPDEVVWLELLKGYLTLSSEAMKAIGNEGFTLYHMADLGLEEFKQRFRNEVSSS